jgi:glycosyltransferase involved in cell wall biosynthesis
MISSLKLQEAVILTKTLQLEEIPTYLSAADVMVLPLLDNFVDGCRWPNRLLEYMACGRPVVVSSVGEAPKIVAKHKCGLVAQSEEPTDLAQKIDYLLVHPQEAYEMGLRARLAVEQTYTWSSVTKSTEQVYRALEHLG